MAANDFLEVWFGNLQVDMGDLPIHTTAGVPYAVDYFTLMAHDGPRHVIRDIQLGPAITAEIDGKPCPMGALDLDDGVTPVDLELWAVGEDGGAVQVQVTAIGSTNVTIGYVNAWIDWNQDGHMTLAEQILLDAPVSVGTTQTLIFDIPEDAGSLNDIYYARFRLYSAPQMLLDSGAMPTGLAYDGEVEDYR